MARISIATFNVNSVRMRLPILEKWLKDRSIDVLCLQETKVVDEDFPVAAFKEMGYRAVFRGEKSYNGVAILTKVPMDGFAIGFGDGEEPECDTRLVRGRIGDFCFINTYVPQGTDPLSEKFAYKLGWFERLRAFFDERFSPDKPLLWAGDFNVAPEPIDVHDPKRLLGQVGFHPDEHRALARVREWGFVDVFRKHRPGPNEYTFWDYRVRDSVARGLGWRVDHIWATAPLAELSVGAGIDTAPRLAQRPSDHTFIYAEFEGWEEAGAKGGRP